MKIFKFVVAALLIGAGAGFIPTYLQLRDAREQATAMEERLTMDLEEARANLAISSIHSRLGILLLEVRQSDFEAARTTSTELYDEINRVMLSTEDPDEVRRLRTIAETRDQVTAALALNEPSVEGVIERLFSLISASLS